jgi:hypothetical protein
MLKGILKDQEFNSSDELEEKMTRLWHDVTSDNVQGVFGNCTICFAWIIEDGGEYTHKSKRS